jgi:filamentous hemagglutinin family protein
MRRSDSERALRRLRVLRHVLAGSTSVAAILLQTQAMAAGPTGGTVVGGHATITTPSSTSTVITQSTEKAIIDWQNFSISSGSSTTFLQPNSAAITLNRVTGSGASEIDGNLFANGHIWIINGNGILFGKGSQINVGSLIATTADIANNDFLSGDYNFGGASANHNASVVNKGTIRAASGGSIVLAGPVVSNQGLIQADLGSVVLGGGNTFTVDFQGDKLIQFAIAAPVSQTPVDANGHAQTLVSNSGTVSAQGGRIVMTARAAEGVADNVINNTGIVEATSVHSENGEIVFDGGDSGTVNIGGTVDATGKGAGETGGSVTVTGKNVVVANGTRIDASGFAGGGTVQIGAGSDSTTIGKAIIKANAIHAGNGGKVLVTSAGATSIAGHLSARGGWRGGNGGQIETSGNTLSVATGTKVNTQAPMGLTGTWLLDPTDIVIDADGGTQLSGGNLGVGTDPNGTDFVSTSTIIAALGTSNVTLEASDDISVDSDLVYSSSNALNLLAGNNINVNASIQNTQTSQGGAINLVAGWDGTTLPTGNLTAPGAFGNNGGSVFIGNNADSDGFNAAVGSASGTTTIAGDGVTLNGANGYAQIGYHGAGGGDIVIDAATLELDGGFEPSNYAQIGNGELVGEFSGDVTGNISATITGTTAFNRADADSPAQMWIGNVTGNGTETGNVTLITGDASSNVAFGDADSLGAMLVADLGTSASTGGDVTFATTAPQTDFINTYLNTGAIEYSSPHSLTLLSTGNVTLPYSIQNDGTGDLTVLAGWNADVTPDAALTTPGGFGQNGAFLWVVGATGTGLTDSNPRSDGGYSVGDSGNGTAVGSKGGVTTVGGATVFVEGLTGYGQVGYAGSGGTGAIQVIANGTPSDDGASGAGACFDGGGNICVIGGRQGEDVENPTYAQIGDLGLGVAGTGESDITVSATGNLTIAGGGIYETGTDPAIANAYGMIGNGDASQSAAQTVSGTIDVTVAGNTNFSSSTASGSQAWLGNRSDADGVQSGDLTLISGTVDGDSVSAMFAEDLGSSDDTGGNVTIGLTGTQNLTIVEGAFYSSPHTLSLLSTNDVIFEGSVQNAGSGDINIVAGWSGVVGDNGFGNNSGSVLIGLAAAPGDVAVGSAGGTVSVSAANLVLDGVNGYAQLGYHSGGGGNINVNLTQDLYIDGGDSNTQFQDDNTPPHGTQPSGADYAMIGNGAIVGGEVEGGVTGDIDIRAAGITEFSDNTSGVAWLGNASGGSPESGNVTLVTGSLVDLSQITDLNTIFADDLNGGDFTLGFTGEGTTTVNSEPFDYSSSHTFNLLSTNDISVGGSIQNSGSGAINIVAGWDGLTLDPAQFNQAGVFGNNNEGVTIGGNTQGVSVGSRGGMTSIDAASLMLDGSSGFAQLGYHGNGAGALDVTVIGDVALNGGDDGGGFAQIGNGGAGTSGSNSGDISILAGGDVTLTGGSSSNTYAQIGHGGAQSNTSSEGYSNSGLITVSGEDVILAAGSGSASYAQIGQGGYQSGSGLTGTATDSGNISVTASRHVTLTGNGDDAYAQIGNGGDQVNANASAGAHGTISGDIVVQAPDGVDGAVSLSAGAGNNAYAQIGNGGYASNASANAIPANFLVSGNITVSDLALTGGGTNGYAQIGNGDASLSNLGDISGDITIEAFGQVVTTNGSGANSTATIGNATGNGTVSGAITGYPPPNTNPTTPSDPSTVGVLATLADSTPPPAPPVDIFATQDAILSQEIQVTSTTGDTPVSTDRNNPLEQLTDSSGEGGKGKSSSRTDAATDALGNSLSGKHATATRVLIGGLLKQTFPAASGARPRGVPPADDDFASWGNEALWQ